MIRIALTLLNIVKTANQSSNSSMGDEQFVMILAMLSSIELSRNSYLIRLVAEINVHLLLPRISHSPEAALEELIADIEKNVGTAKVDVSKLTRAQAAARTANLQRSSAVLGLLYRHFEYETILSPFNNRIAVLITRVFHDEQPEVRAFSQHYATVMALEGPCEESFYQKIFLNCFHLNQLDK